MTSHRQIVESAFDAWSNGAAHIAGIFADAMTWEIVGRSAVSRRYADKKQFVDEVLAPFGARFDPGAPFRPVRIRGIHADGDTVVVSWDGEGTTTAGTVYRNTYAWFMRLEGGLVVDGTAFYDSIAFNELWEQVPADQPVP